MATYSYQVNYLSPCERHGQQKVSFGLIEIYEHGYELGDNPSVSDGAPVTIGWEPQNQEVFDVSYFEACYPSEKRHKASKLGVARRAEILLKSGYTIHEIAECTLSVLHDKHKRCSSLRNRKWDSWNALKEKTARSLRKVARRPRRGSLIDTISTDANSPASAKISDCNVASTELPLNANVRSKPGLRPRRASIGPSCCLSTDQTCPEWLEESDDCSIMLHHQAAVPQSSALVGY